MSTRRGPGAVAAVVVAAALGVAMLTTGTGPAGAGDQRFPAFTAPVVDAADVVPDDVERQVDAALTDYQGRTGNQVAVAVVQTTGGRSIEDYSIDLARAWGVGQKGTDNGVLLLIAQGDRRVRIEVGRGLEGELTDLESGRIIRERLLPLLRNGDVGQAVLQGTEAIRKDLGDPRAGELPPVAAPVDRQPGADSSWFPLLFLVMLPAFALLGFARRRRRRWWGLGGPIIWGGGWGGGGWGGGGWGGGGGFSGGGGGSFGGGGASGGW